MTETTTKPENPEVRKLIKRLRLNRRNAGVSFQREHSPYRADKRLPKDFTITATQDYGRIKEVTTFRSPTVETETRLIPSKGSGHFKLIVDFGDFHIKQCLDDGKFYKYTGHYPHDKWFGEIGVGEMADKARQMLRALGCITETLNVDGRGHKYIRLTIRNPRKGA
jgi:hypothetical protein